MRRWRKWCFRAAAICLGLCPFVIFELLCHAFGWGDVDHFDDPFVGFSEVVPLFTQDTESPQRQLKIADSRRKFFAEESFPFEKPKSGFRIFCLGGSTVQGRPFSIPTAFSTWLELSLNAGDSAREWNAINCGGVSYASYRLIPIIRECLEYEPDLFIICTGHNEFLEDRSYGDLNPASSRAAAISQQLMDWRSIRVLRGMTEASPKKANEKPILPTETDPLLDYQGGLEAYHRDDVWRDAVIAHFNSNIRRLIAIAQQHNVPVLLLRPTSNLGDSPPFKSQHRDGITEQESLEWQTSINKARSLYRLDMKEAAHHLRRAIEIDDQYALTHFELSQCLQSMRQMETAKSEFLLARELDICPLRIIAPLEQALFEIADDTDTLLIDLQQLMESHSRNEIVGSKMLVDHVHPSIRGHQLIAQAIAENLAHNSIFKPTADWPDRRDSAFKSHRDSLSDVYYFHGQQTLENLRRWAQGRVNTPPK